MTEATASTILVLTHWFDPTTDWVVDELNRREVSVLRCDAADFPQRVTLSAAVEDGRITGYLRTVHRAARLEEVSGIYYRRPTMFEFPEGMSGPERRWATSEARQGFGGAVAAMRGWLNHPQHIARATYKPLQLRLAAEAGLTTPRTLVTNDPQRARRFAEQVGQVIYKPLSAGGVQEAGQHRALYANRLTPDDCEDPSVALTAHMFQEHIEHDHAVRMTVVNDRFFTVAIHLHSEAARIDWRRDYTALTYETVAVPADVRNGVLTLMHDLGLRFAALDFLVTPQREWTFLEVNPNGQWAWIDETAPKIAEAIADALTAESPIT